jgi:hypothetical protein
MSACLIASAAPRIRTSGALPLGAARVSAVGLQTSERRSGPAAAGPTEVATRSGLTLHHDAARPGERRVGLVAAPTPAKAMAGRPVSGKPTLRVDSR